MKKVMLLGDSIRMSYMEAVKKNLEGEVDVWGPAENCRFAKYTLWCVNQWIGECGKPDIIHWNNGIWDIYYQNPEMGIFTPLAEYTRDLGRVLTELRKTEAHIIWATTTPAKPESSTCDNDRIDKYNAKAAEFMAREGLEINDLNSLLRQDLDKHIAEDCVHLSEAGVEACAGRVAEAIRPHL